MNGQVNTQAVRQDGEELGQILDVTPQMVAVFGPTWDCLYANRPALEYFGLTIEESRRVYDPLCVLQPEDLERIRREVGSAPAGSGAHGFEARLRRKDGIYRWFLIHSNPVCDEQSRITRWYVSATDVEDSKQAEQTLRQSEEYLAEAQALSHTGSFAYHPRTRDPLYWSEEMFRLLGFDPHGPLPEWSAWNRRIHPQDHDRVMERFESSLLNKMDSSDEYRLIMPDGALKYIQTTRHPVLNEHNEIIRLVGTIIDITERKRAEDALRRSEKQLWDVIQTMPSISSTIRPDGAMEFVNRRWEEFTGISAADSVGQGWQRAIHPDDLERYTMRRSASLADGNLFEDEIRIRCGATGEYRWFMSRAVPLRDEHGEILRWYTTMTDIDDRKRAQERLQHENVALREEIDKSWIFDEIVGASSALRSVLSAVSKVAPTDSTVLITGETGTGKELVARAIHRKSACAAHPFITVNCAAIPESLIASELFGHEKGAFTSALQRRVGKFELAEGGTILLDEVGDLPMETQISLLRVLQEREFQRVGGNQTIRVNARVLAATNCDLQKAVAEGTFRQDLFYRLSVFPIHVPSLHERKTDIPLLVEYFIARLARKAHKNIRNIEKKSLELLQAYSWPGNIRELQNVIERAVIVCDTETLTIDDNWLSLGNLPQASTGTLGRKSRTEEKEVIEMALTEARGKVAGASGAAAKLGIPPSTLEYKIRLLGIDKYQFKRYPRAN